MLPSKYAYRSDSVSKKIVLICTRRVYWRRFVLFYFNYIYAQSKHEKNFPKNASTSVNIPILIYFYSTVKVPEGVEIELILIKIKAPMLHSFLFPPSRSSNQLTNRRISSKEKWDLKPLFR